MSEEARKRRELLFKAELHRRNYPELLHDDFMSADIDRMDLKTLELFVLGLQLKVDQRRHYEAVRGVTDTTYDFLRQHASFLPSGQQGKDAFFLFLNMYAHMKSKQEEKKNK